MVCRQYPHRGIGLSFEFPLYLCPYLWLWLSYGGWRGDYLAVVEPWTSCPVTLSDAVAAGTHRVLKPGEQFACKTRVTPWSSPVTLSSLLHEKGLTQTMKSVRRSAAFFCISAALILAQISFPSYRPFIQPQSREGKHRPTRVGKLLPFPMSEDTGYSYNSHLLTQWNIIWDQFNRQRYQYFFCCFDFDRTTFEMQPEYHWANSTGYLRAMMEGFIERL